MTREQLIASLTATNNANTVVYDDGSYIDWTSEGDAPDTLNFEVGNSAGDAVQLDLTREQLVALHTQLTLTLLADAK